jgi:hypothetical protein
MVYVIPLSPEEADTLKAYLVTEITASQLEHFKRAFERGANVHFRPTTHLKIIQASETFANRTHAQMRSQENEAGNPDPFIVIDDQMVEKGAVWYVNDFADEFDIECGFAESEEVVMKALVRIERLAISHICWREGNPPMGEELEALPSSVVPLRLDSEQSEPLGTDVEEDDLWDVDEIEIIAESGEYETTTDYTICSNMSPMPRESVRLLPSVARREGLVSDWTWPRRVKTASKPDDTSESDDASEPDLGSEADDNYEVDSAESVRMSARYERRVPRLRYEWPEGSL